MAGVLIRKKRIRAKIWYPGWLQAETDPAQEESPPAKKTRVSQSDSFAGALINSTENSSISNYIEQGSKAAKMESGSGKGKVHWMDHRVPVEDSPQCKSPEMATIGQLGNDSRKWEFLHYASMHNPGVMQILMDGCKEVNKESFDPNTPGPGGYTPLMLIITQRNSHRYSGAAPSCSSSSSESSAETSEHNALLSPMSKNSPRFDTCKSSVTPGNATPPSPYDCSIDCLLKAKAKVDATNDYGHTALHIAAVCACGDCVKKLLAAGANPNVQDNWGQTPLHATIGASAEGAFHILVSYQKTDINVKSDGGITPLMGAVKFLNLYMVKQLVKKNADISAIDCEGRTAVHWAAMVNFVVALKLLIRQGPDAIKDAQDSKGQTALFLACREGCEDIVKHLLDVFANATLPDNLDRSPMFIACERQHTNIVEVLKSHVPYSNQLPPNNRAHVSHAPQVQMTAHLKLEARQQHQRALLRTGQSPHPVMMEIQPKPMDQFGGYHCRPGHHFPEMHLSTHCQTFSDLSYPVPPVMSPPEMEIGFPNGDAPIPIQLYWSPSTPLFLSDTMTSDVSSTTNPPTHNTTVLLHQPSTSSEHRAPCTPITYSQHHSPPTQTVHPSQPPPSTPDVTLSHNQFISFPDSCPVYTTTNHFTTSAMNQSEQMMVNELIMSMVEDSTLQPSSNTPVTTPTTAKNTRLLQHLNEPNLPAYPTSDLYSTAAQPQHQQICSPLQLYSTTSINSNRNPSTLYPSPPNSDL